MATSGSRNTAPKGGTVTDNIVTDSNGLKLTLPVLLKRTWIGSGAAIQSGPPKPPPLHEGSAAPAGPTKTGDPEASAPPPTGQVSPSSKKGEPEPGLPPDHPHFKPDADSHSSGVRHAKFDPSSSPSAPWWQRLDEIEGPTGVPPAAVAPARKNETAPGQTVGVWTPLGPAPGTGHPQALVLFSGPGEAATHLPSALAAAGFEARAVDTLIGGAQHDLTDDAVAGDYIRRIRAGHYSLVALGTPCSSYSVLREPRLRSKADPTGVDTAPPDWLDSIQMHNQLAEVTAAAIHAAHDSATPWLLENPSDVGDPRVPWFWPEKASHASLFDQPVIIAALQRTSARQRAFAMCAFGTPWRKMTTIAFGGPLRSLSEPLDQRGCPHGSARHEARLDEHDASGRKLATIAGAYPAELCHELANYAALALAEVPARHPAANGRCDAANTAEALEESPSNADGAMVDGAMLYGGRIAHGRQLHPSLAKLVHARRHSASAFASTRNLEAESAEVLRWEPLPAGLHIPPDDKHRPRKRKKSRPLPRPNPPAESSAAPDTPCLEPDFRPDGPIAIEQLFLPGVYEERIESWFALADEAGRALQRRQNGSKEPLPRVETRVIEQHEMQPFARGLVWDCANPRDVVPVEWSTVQTYVPGKKQLDREGLRLMATELGNTQNEVINQACGGGLEITADCELITVLAFHHEGLLEEIDAARKAVENGLMEQWTDAPTRHLPFVPCRLQPRDVVMQDRVRVKKGEYDDKGRPVIESYTKARVTTNSSYGGDDSVNAAISEGERAVRLPRAQWQARALAIADQACYDRYASHNTATAAGQAPGAHSDETEPLEELARGGAPGPPAGHHRATTSRGTFKGRKSLENALKAVPFAVGNRHQLRGPDGNLRELHAVSFLADAESAYNYCHVQVAHQWLQCFLWWDAQGRAGTCRDRRLPFGGASSPSQFQQISTQVTAFARKMQCEFDQLHPPPLPARRWTEERREAQRRGTLPGDPAQLHPSYSQVYIDDAGGVALDDPVPTPDVVTDIHISDEPTRALGGTFPPADSRVLVHAKLLLLAMQMAGLHASPGKVFVGDPIITLGFHVDRSAWRMKVPETKRAAMLADAASLAAEAALHASAARRQALTFVGRLTNISQVLPELKPYLRGGYRATDTGWAKRAGVRAPDTQQLRAGSLAHTEWQQLLEVADDLLTQNEGIPLAPRRVFPSPRDGAIISTTDASGDDGFGGYVFLPGGDPSEVWVVSEPWPEWALEARRMNDRTTADKESAHAAEFSVPAAELFASWAVPMAVCEASGRPAHMISGARVGPNGDATLEPPVIAIGDCQPAVYVIDSATSGEAVMRGILTSARQFSRFWLGVHVPREANRDADGLSHPANVEQIMSAARAAGFQPRRARVPAGCFEGLHAAIQRGLAFRRDAVTPARHSRSNKSPE